MKQAISLASRVSGRKSASPLTSRRTFKKSFTVHKKPRVIKIFPDWLMEKPDFKSMLETTEDYSIQFAVSKAAKTDSDIRIISDYLRTLEFFKSMPKFQLNAVSDLTKLKHFVKGETIVKQGEPATEMYVILNGVVDIIINGEIVNDVPAGNIVGESVMKAEH